MKLHRINALVIRHLYLYKRSLPRLMDIFFWPVTELFLWGFLSMYLERLNLGGIGIISVLLGAVIFWDLLSQSQRALSTAFLEDVWEKNFLNIFVTPLKVSEFLMSVIVLGIIRIILVGVVMGVIALLLYNFNILKIGIYLVPFVVNLLIFGWTLGLFSTAIILRFGSSAQVLAFGLIFLLQPFSAVFYPVSALPVFLQNFARVLPPSYIFEGMRNVISTGTPVSLSQLMPAFLINLVYFLLVLWFFRKMFYWVKNKGLLLKLD